MTCDGHGISISIMNLSGNVKQLATHFDNDADGVLAGEELTKFFAECKTQNIDIPQFHSTEQANDTPPANTEGAIEGGNVTHPKANSEPVKEGTVDRFKQLDTNGDMHLSKKEICDAAIEQYCKAHNDGTYIMDGFYSQNGNAIDEILGTIAQLVEQFGGDDGELNIDEYRDMITSQIRHSQEVAEVTRMKEESIKQVACDLTDEP